MQSAKLILNELGQSSFTKPAIKFIVTMQALSTGFKLLGFDSLAHYLQIATLAAAAVTGGAVLYNQHERDQRDKEARERIEDISRRGRLGLATEEESLFLMLRESPARVAALPEALKTMETSPSSHG